MGVKNLEANLRRLVSGGIDFAVFTRETALDYERMAAYLLRRWHPPSSVCRDDMVQELLLATWKCVWSFDQTRVRASGSHDLANFVVYGSMSHAKRWLHKARGAKLCGTPDKNPSRIPRPFSSFQKDGAAREETLEEIIGRFASTPATAETELLEEEDKRAHVRLVLSACRTPLQRRVVSAIAAAEDVDGAGAILYDDLDLRFGLQVGSEEIMSGVVAAVAKDVVARVS